MPDGVDRRLRRALGRRGQQARSSSWRAARRSPTTTTCTESASGYQGITIPKAQRATVVRGGILEMDEPEHSTYRGALNPYLSPAAIKRWVPFVDEIARAALDEKIESGRIDFVDDLANIVPAVLTLAMMGIELEQVADLQRARPRRRCPPRNTRPTPRASPR